MPFKAFFLFFLKVQHIYLFIRRPFLGSPRAGH